MHVVLLVCTINYVKNSALTQALCCVCQCCASLRIWFPCLYAEDSQNSTGGPPSVGDTVSFPQSVPTSLGEGTNGREVQGDRVAVEPGEGAVSPPQGLHAVPDEVIPGSRPDIAIPLTNLAQNS